MAKKQTSWIPLLWRFLLSKFWLVWLGCTLAFELLFVAAKIGDLARLIAQTGSPALFLKYIVLQLILLFPVAAASACLVSAMSLMRELCQTHQLTAWRALGYSFRLILLPLIASAALISLLNTTVLFHSAALAYRRVKSLAHEQIRKEPLTQLQGSLPAESGLFVRFDSASTKEQIEDLWISAAGDKSAELIHIAHLDASGKTTRAQKVDLISFLPREKKEGFYHLIHEHYDTLLAPIDWLKNPFRAEPSSSLSSATLSEVIQHSEWRSELIRRLAWGLAPITCLLFGIALGLQSERRQAPSWRKIALGLSLALFLIALFATRKLAGSALFLLAAALGIHGLALLMITTLLWRYTRGRL